MSKKNKITRPFPPERIGRFDGAHPVSFVPAPEILEWVRKVFLEEGAPLFNPDHSHLIDAHFNFMWAAGGYQKQGRTILGVTEEIAFRCSPWQKGRQEQQMYEWYGMNYPDYLITLDASYCAQCSDVDFCALVEHELYHIGHKEDEFNSPKFHKQSGLPVLYIRGHDVEEFVGVVKRYGVGRPEGALAMLVDASKSDPLVGKVDIAHACGTCLKLVA